MTALLNAYFTRMDGCIRLSHGRLDKFIGDAIMAVFRDEGPDRRQAQNACRAALAMRREVERFNRKRAAQGLFQVETGIGIASGSVISGRIGSRHGRLDFTVIGDPVNLAARVEAESVKGRKTRILLAPSTIRLLKGQGRLEFLGRLPLKGKSRSFSLYELLGMR
jgi:adenylate cyclase